MTLMISDNCPIIERLPSGNPDLPNFNSTDTARSFNKNLKRSSADWYYRNTPIYYSFNSWGYRTVEYDSLDQDFILCFGCSQTEGIGLRVEDRWSDCLAQRLGCSVYNAGLEGQGADVQMYNSLLWAKSLRLPRAVYVQWPSPYRKTFARLDSEPLNNPVREARFKSFKQTPIYMSHNENGIKRNTDGYWFMNRFTAEEGELALKFWSSYQTLNMLWASLGIPVINFTWENVNPQKFVSICDKPLHQIDSYMLTEDHDFARDLSHQGVRFNRRVAELLANGFDSSGC